MSISLRRMLRSLKFKPLKLNCSCTRRYGLAYASFGMENIGNISLKPYEYKAKTNRRQFTSNLPNQPNNQLSHVWFNIPNTLTFARILATPGICWLILNNYTLSAIGCFWVAGFLDWLDGYFARKLQQHSIVGSFLDPLADKLFVGMTLVTLCYKDLIPWQLGVVIIGRDILLVGGSFVVRYFTKPKDARFFETGLSAGVVSVSPSNISRVNTFAQFGLLWFTLTAEAFNLPPQESLPILWVAVGCTTVLSGLDYLRSSNYKNIFVSRRETSKSK